MVDLAVDRHVKDEVRRVNLALTDILGYRLGVGVVHCATICGWLIPMRVVDSQGPVGARLYAIVEADQWMNIRFLMPATVLFCGGAAFAIRRNPALGMTHLCRVFLFCVG